MRVLHTVLTAGLLLVGGSCGYVSGAEYSSVDALEREYEGRGYVLLGHVGGVEGQPYDAGWPATVDTVKTAMDQVSFTVNGSRHAYPGYIGYELKVVVLRDVNDREYGVVFRSREKLE